MSDSDDSYIPPLGSVVEGRSQLISWKACVEAFTDFESRSADHSLNRHFDNADVLDELRHAIAPRAPDSSSRARFDKEIDRIKSDKSLQELWQTIRDDALWLSQEARILEIIALRIVILERQNARLQELDVQTHNSVLDGEDVENGDGNRRQDILRTYLIEHCSRLEFCGFLISNAGQEPSSQDKSANKKSQKLQSAGHSLMKQWIAVVDSRSDESVFFNHAMKSMRSNLEALSNGFKWSGLDQHDQSIMSLWTFHLAKSIYLNLQLIQIISQAHESTIKPGRIVSWFRFMLDVRYFQEFQVPEVADSAYFLGSMQAVTALISLNMVRLSAALDFLSEANSSNPRQEARTESRFYLEDQEIFVKINDLMMESAIYFLASPAILAWSIITQHVRELAAAARETRELRQSFQAADSYSPTRSGRSIDDSGANKNRNTSAASDLSLRSTHLELIHDSLMIASVETDPIAHLATCAVSDGNVFNALIGIVHEYCRPIEQTLGEEEGQKSRYYLLELIRASLAFIEYQPLLIECLLSIVNIDSDDNLSDRQRPNTTSKLSTVLQKDEIFRQKFLLVALSRFPYEAMPMIQIWISLARECANTEDSSRPFWSDLESLDTFTSRLPLEFAGYKTIREDEEGDYIELIHDLPVDVTKVSLGETASVLALDSAAHSSRQITPSPSSIILRRTTRGQVLSRGKPLVVAWHHEYSALAYMAAILQAAAPSNGLGDSDAVDVELLTVIIDLFDTVLDSINRDREVHTITRQESAEAAAAFLQHADQGVNHDSDVVAVIYDLMEAILFKPEVALNEGLLSLLSSCLKFTNALLRLMPDRVWPFISRGALFSQNESANFLSTILASRNMNRPRAEILLTCMRLFDNLIIDTIENGVERHSSIKTASRFISPTTVGSGISSASMKSVLGKIEHIALEVMTGLCSWRFEHLGTQERLTHLMYSIQTRLLGLAAKFGLEPQWTLPALDEIATAAQTSLTAYLNPQTTDLLRLALQSCQERSALVQFEMEPHSRMLSIQACVAILHFILCIVNVANQMASTDTEAIVSLLCEHCSTFISLYSRRQEYRVPVLRILSGLAQLADNHESQPRSIFGSLSPKKIAAFNGSLSSVKAPLEDEALIVAQWNFCESMVSQRQQWIGHMIINGPEYLSNRRRQRLDSLPTARPSHTPLLVCLENLSSLESHGSRSALAMLRFISCAADFYPSALHEIEEHPTFLRKISEWLSHVDLREKSGFSSAHDHTDFCHRLQMAACITEILALLVRETMGQGNAKFSQMIVPHIQHVSSIAVNEPAFNFSLHSNLHKNLQSRYPGFSLHQLTKRFWGQGEDIFEAQFDIRLADSMFKFDRAWGSEASGQGFHEELRRVNANVMLVKSRLKLFYSWRKLFIQLSSSSLASEEKFQISMAKTVNSALRTNSEREIPDYLAKDLGLAKADLAFALTERLVHQKTKVSEALDIIFSAWELVRPDIDDLSSILASTDGPRMRINLRVLYLALQLHSPQASGKPGKSDGQKLVPAYSKEGPILQIGLEILSQLVSRGFRSLASLLHESPGSIEPQDLTLLTGLLRTCLKIQHMDQHPEALLQAFVDTQTPRCAASLLSWADRLHGEPLYGEIAMSFLVELSSVPALAESLAVDGILGHVLSTNFIKLLQDHAVTPTCQPIQLFQIWAGGILPLMLNLLFSIGAPMAAEISAAINTFPHQLRRAAHSFDFSRTRYMNTGLKSSSDSRGSFLTLSLVRETHYLSMIMGVLQTFREAGASAAIVASRIDPVAWDWSSVKDNLEVCIQRWDETRARIMPLNQRDEDWAHTAMTDGSKGNILEHKIMTEMKGALTVLNGISSGTSGA